MQPILWIRAETKKNERRVPVSPLDAKTLIEAGFDLHIEECSQRAIKLEGYKSVGCKVEPHASWVNAPKEAIILGIKELPESNEPLIHRHIFFGHVFKEQPGWQDMLARFKNGGGTLLDLEFLTNEDGRRVAAFGYWAGFAGAAAGVKTWIGQQKGHIPSLASLSEYLSQEALVNELNSELTALNQKPTMLVVGALGRCGTGASDLAKSLGITPTKWDMAETARGAPFPEILQHDIFVNSILASPTCPLFVPKSALDDTNGKLSVIADVSCDPQSMYNPIPIYNQTTTFNAPVIRAGNDTRFIDVIAIDHLPSMLPVESSIDYSTQLLPTLLSLKEDKAPVWQRAETVFNTHINKI